jgi:glutaminyl-tRNA synthetase
LEFENNRDIYDWLLDTLPLTPPRPYQHEFARLNISYTVMSKRKLLELVQEGIVSGWDDPRMPTIAGLRRRGYTPESILNFCEQIGVAKANSVVDVAQLEFAIRDDLNLKVPRVMCVLDPIKVTIQNYDGSEDIEASYYPPDVPKEGSRVLPFSREIYINRDDFSLNPPKGYYRLSPTQPVRLKYAYIIKCDEVICDDDGNVVEIIASYYPNSKSGADTSGIKVKSAIQWVEANSAKEVEVRVYDRLYKVENPQTIEDINPNSLQIIEKALIEPSVVEEKPDCRYQFEREGYFYEDHIDSSDEKLVFNKIVSLKDSWAKKKKPKPQTSQPKKEKKVQIDGEVTPMTPEQEAKFERYTKLKLNTEVANTLARDEALSLILEETLSIYSGAVTVANIIANDVARELKQSSDLKFGAKQIATLAKMIDDETISNKIAKDVFEMMTQSGDSPEDIVEQKGLKQISDESVIAPIIDEVIAKNPDNLQKYKDGNTKLAGFFVGQVLKATGGKANPKIVNTLVAKKLQEA